MLTHVRAALKRRSDKKYQQKYVTSMNENQRIVRELSWTSEESSTYSLKDITGFSDEDPLPLNIPNESTSNEAMQCTICLDHQKNVVLNCGHCFCALCYNSLVQYQAPCPNCREPIRQGMRVYL